MIKATPPPINEPMLDERGIVTRIWADFFISVWGVQKALKDGVADGTYTLSGGATDGEITIVDGVITEVQESA